MAGSSPRALDAAELLAVAGDLYRVLVSGEESGGSACVLEGVVSPGGGPPPHTHTREDESFYILEGELTFQTEDGTVVAGPGTSVFAPRHRRHRFYNATDRPVRMLLTVVPAGIERMFREVSMRVEPGATAAPPPTPEHIAAIIEACPRYGVTVFGPG